jgi:hypothetical protein
MRVLIAAILVCLVTLVPARATSWSVKVTVVPNPMPYGSVAMVRPHTRAGASCAPSITSW